MINTKRNKIIAVLNKSSIRQYTDFIIEEKDKFSQRKQYYIYKIQKHLDEGLFFYTNVDEIKIYENDSLEIIIFLELGKQNKQIFQKQITQSPFYLEKQRKKRIQDIVL